jgi:hypothetical protein
MSVALVEAERRTVTLEVGPATASPAAVPPLTGTITANGKDVFIGRVGCAGQLRWIDGFGDGDGQHAHGVTPAPEGGAYLAGNFLGSINFGQGNLPAGEFTDVFVAHFAPPRLAR